MSVWSHNILKWHLVFEKCKNLNLHPTWRERENRKTQKIERNSETDRDNRKTEDKKREREKKIERNRHKDRE